MDAEKEMRVSIVVIVGAMLATGLVYQIGLHGPFVLDDANNLNPIQEWLSGTNTWRNALFYNTSGTLGRSLSMATLMLNAWLGGYEPYTFKIGNLVIHLLCGAVGWQLLRSALARDRNLSHQAELTAALLTAIWLLHPLNVSTVLYAVQRMAQVSTLFTLAAVWTYLTARVALDDGRTRYAISGLFVLFPLLFFAGLLGKENAAVAPALCLVFELAYFRDKTKVSTAPAQKFLPRIFFSVFLVAPTLLALAAIVLHPDRILGGYSGRDFTLEQRLLSEGRALIDYIGALLLPRTPNMGVFTDDFPVSMGLWTPPTTFYALLVLTAVSIFAIGIRKRAPSFFAGWFFFLVAHVVESSFLPLELYFEHRNYLPAFGLLLATAGLAEFLTRRLRAGKTSRSQLGILAVAGYILVLGFATHGRARVWSDESTFLIQEAQHHPDSVRANVTLALYAVHYGQDTLAKNAMENLLRSQNQRTRELGYLNRVLVDCLTRGSAEPNDLHEAGRLALPTITLSEMYVFEDLASVDAERTCIGAEPGPLAETIETLLAAASAQPDQFRQKWRLRLAAADLRARTGDWSSALRHAKLAWQPNADAAVGDFLARAYIRNGMRKEAEETYEEMVRRAKTHDTNDQVGLKELRKHLDGIPNTSTIVN